MQLNQNIPSMKKLLIAFTLLLIISGKATAAKTTKSSVKSSIETAQSSGTSTAAVLLYNYEVLQAENTKLLQQAESLSVKVEELTNKLGYTQMMHSAIFDLNAVVFAQTAEETTGQLEYAYTMHTAIAQLGSELVLQATEDAADQVNYAFVMHTALNHIGELADIQSAEEAQCQKEYDGNMQAMLTNLALLNQ